MLTGGIDVRYVPITDILEVVKPIESRSPSGHDSRRIAHHCPLQHIVAKIGAFLKIVMDIAEQLAGRATPYRRTYPSQPIRPTTANIETQGLSYIPGKLGINAGQPQQAPTLALRTQVERGRPR